MRARNQSRRLATRSWDGAIATGVAADPPATSDDGSAGRAAEDRDRARAEAVFDRWPILPFDRPRRRDDKARDRSRQLRFPPDDLARDPDIAFAMKTARAFDMKSYLRRRWDEFLAAVRQDLATGRIDAQGRATGRQVDRGPYYRDALGKLIDHPDVRDVVASAYEARQRRAETIEADARAAALQPVLAVALYEVGRILLADDRRRRTTDLPRLSTTCRSDCLSVQAKGWENEGKRRRR